MDGVQCNWRTLYVHRWCHCVVVNCMLQDPFHNIFFCVTKQLAVPTSHGVVNIFVYRCLVPANFNWRKRLYSATISDSGTFLSQGAYNMPYEEFRRSWCFTGQMLLSFISFSVICLFFAKMRILPSRNFVMSSYSVVTASIALLHTNLLFVVRLALLHVKYWC